MKRVALFLKEKQIKNLKALANKQELPWAFVARRAIDYYFLALRESKRGFDKELEESPVGKSQTPTSSGLRQPAEWVRRGSRSIRGR